ncbi:MAG: hypothetical protein BWY87_00909 [Deltaproteobacteria bacterium ADurb.Bin510]|nr:MAG: hypothetical protein BWY87_00909 [Deltaproteobacteria bacterium ADurb.Bin510]
MIACMHEHILSLDAIARGKTPGIRLRDEYRGPL